MTEFLFPDNTVLCNFATIDRVDLLKSVLDGRGRWTAAVKYEARRSARVIPALNDLLDAGWLSEAIEVSAEADILQISKVRRAVFGGTDDRPLKHLGEAETCFVILEWSEFEGAWWISDDREALRYARSQGITTRETIDLMKMAVVHDHVTAKDAFDLMLRMKDNGRHLKLPSSPADLRS